MAWTTFTANTRANAAEVNGNFALTVRRDSAATISVTHTFSVIQTLTGGASIGVSKLTSPSDGVILWTDAAGTAFSRMQFGGTTSSFPAIKRSSTTIHFRLADDSAFCNINAAAGTFSGAVDAGTNISVAGAATTQAAGVLSIGNTTQSTVGAAGGASALPATPTGYIKTFIGSTQFVIPYYAQA